MLFFLNSLKEKKTRAQAGKATNLFIVEVKTHITSLVGCLSKGLVWKMRLIENDNFVEKVPIR